MLKLLLILYAIWGFNWVVMKGANLFFPPITFACFRFLSGAAVLLLVNIWLKLPLPPRRWWPWIGATGFLQIAYNNAAMQTGMTALSAGLVAVLNYTMPMWITILAHFFLNERVTRRKAVGACVSMAGMCILMNIDSAGSIYYILLTLSGAIAWAIAGTIIKYQNRALQGGDCNLIQYTTWQMVAGALILLLYITIFDQGEVRWTWMGIGCLAYNGILASAVAFFLWHSLLTRMEAGKASIAILGVPVVGVICGIIFLGEALRWHTALGMLLVLSGILLIVTQHGAPAK